MGLGFLFKAGLCLAALCLVLQLLFEVVDLFKQVLHISCLSLIDFFDLPAQGIEVQGRNAGLLLLRAGLLVCILALVLLSLCKHVLDLIDVLIMSIVIGLQIADLFVDDL